jgi:hypothetical protein
MVIGGGAGAVITVPVSVERGRTTSSQTRERDNEIFWSNTPTEAGAFVIDHQHLLRTVLRVRVPIVLGPDTDFTVKGYYEFLEDVSTQMTEGRSFDPAFSTVEYRRDCRYLRVFTDIDKFGRLLMFGWKARKPYLMSLNDFLPPSSVLRVDKKVPDTDDLGLIRLALGNLARVLSVILGESLIEFNDCLKPAVDMLEVRTIQTVPTSYICYQISMGLEIVMKKMKKRYSSSGRARHVPKDRCISGFRGG